MAPSGRSRWARLDRVCPRSPGSAFRVIPSPVLAISSLHRACRVVYVLPMTERSNRVNVVLDAEHALKLRRIAERTHTNPGTIARSLLTTAIEESDPDPRDVTALLDGLPGAFEQATRGLAEARRGLGTDLEDL